MKILALDCATKICGYAILTNGKPICWGILTSNDKSLDKRIKSIYTQVGGLIRKHSIDLIVCEDNFDRLNLQTFKSLSLMEGAIMGLAFSQDLPIYRVLPSKWRSILGFRTGNLKGQKRNIQKEIALQFVNLNYGLRIECEDAAEAVCIGLAYEKGGIE